VRVRAGRRLLVFVVLVAAVAAGVDCGGSRTQNKTAAPSTRITSTTVDIAAVCEQVKRDQQKQTYVTLDTQAEHDAVLRELSDVQQQILKNEAELPSASCAELCKDDSTTTTDSSATRIQFCPDAPSVSTEEPITVTNTP
jgi:hypothetical protein